MGRIQGASWGRAEFPLHLAAGGGDGSRKGSFEVRPDSNPASLSSKLSEVSELVASVSLSLSGGGVENNAPSEDRP